MNPDPIDDLARALPPYRPAASHVEQVRTAVLAGAPGVTRLPRTSRRVAYALLAVALVAALAAAATVAAMMERPASAPDEPALPAPHRGAVVVDAGEPRDAPEIAVETASPPVPVEPPRRGVAEAPPERPRKVQQAPPVPPAPVVKAAAPGEAEFRAGWAALKAGEPASAADSFAAARQAKGSTVAEDAAFWEGIALERAGKSSKAIAALRRFISKYPSSSRAGEAAAKLGWLLHDAGDLDAAERYFESASDDVVPKVQKSARDGLESIARKREAP